MKEIVRRNPATVLLMSLVLFACLILGPVRGLSFAEGAQAAIISLILAAVFASVMAIACRELHPDKKTLLLTGLILGLSVLARAALLDYQSADYVSFLSGWVQYFREKGIASLGENVGDYNLLYQYALLLISQLPVHDLYLIKLLTIIFDYALALAMMKAAGRLAGEETRLPVLLIVPLLPTVLVDGSCWGQCDPVYTFAIILSLYWLESGKPWRSACALALAFAFKLQTVFFFPVVLLALLHGKYKPKHALAFFAAYFATLIPAMLAGRSLMSALMVYVNQSMGQYYHRLSYNAPNLYLFFPLLEFRSNQEFTWLRFVTGVDYDATNAYLTEDLFPTLQHAALIAAVLLVLALVVYWLIRSREITPDMTLCFALFFAIFLPFVLPKIHDRYFFLADMLSVLYAAKRSDRRFLPMLTIGASLGSYMNFLMRQRPVDERVLALMMFAALILVGHDLLRGMRANRAALKGGSL